MKAIILLTTLFPMSLFAQKTDLGNWLIYFGDKKINNNWNWHHEIQYRNFNYLGDIEQLLIRTGLGYNLSEDNNNVLLGYAYIYHEPYQTGNNQKAGFHEHRVYQQYITRQKFNRFHLQHRYRFEQRYYNEDVNLRFRYFFLTNLLLNQNQWEDKTFYLSMYNEIFIDPEGPGFDRNRIYGGLGFRFSKNWRTELGIMNQTSKNQSRNQLNLISFVNF